MTRHQREFPGSRPIPVLPLACGRHGWDGGPWAFPRAPNPADQEPAAHVAVGTGRTQTRSYVSGIRRTSSTSSLTTCDLVSQQDLHPNDRGPQGTCHGAVIANGNLYCPQAPRPLLELGPLARTATREQAEDHDRKTAELARYKLGRLTADDNDGYHRVQCPAAAGKIRCPLRPASMTLDRDRPEILHPPEHPQPCCAQQTITVPADVNAKTRQKHDYPSAAWRRSYRRRTGAERGFATAKDPASNDISRGWCRLAGLAPLTLFTTALLVARNQRILTAWDARQQENARRAAAGLPPKTRRRRRKTLTAPITATQSP